jgi:hypothetical protein
MDMYCVAAQLAVGGAGVDVNAIAISGAANSRGGKHPEYMFAYTEARLPGLFIRPNSPAGYRMADRLAPVRRSFRIKRLTAGSSFMHALR